MEPDEKDVVEQPEGAEAPVVPAEEGTEEPGMMPKTDGEDENKEEGDKEEEGEAAAPTV
jgi:hypothetical protein